MQLNVRSFSKLILNVISTGMDFRIHALTKTKDKSLDST